jgi:hypothetical protein
MRSCAGLPGESVKLQLKFRTGTSNVHRQEVIDKATKAGAAAVRPLFPGETDEELASLYVVDIEEAKHHKAVRTVLSDEPRVEFVEDEVRRKLRPTA